MIHLNTNSGGEQVDCDASADMQSTFDFILACVAVATFTFAAFLAAIFYYFF